MSLSNDDDDEFQSADEDGFNEDSCDDLETTKLTEQLKLNKSNEEPETTVEPEVNRSLAQKLERSPSLSDLEKPELRQAPNEEDEEEALAERIRERNLKIARKFSAEIAKSVQASAPITYKTEPPIGFKVDDIDYQDIPDSEEKARQPLAPPPTPALSSSFSAEEASPSSSTQENLGTRYGWRVPIKPRMKQTPDASPKECDINQARAALDKLSEKYTDSDKSLFQKVAEDLKKVAIKSEDPPKSSEDSQASTNLGSSTLPSLSGLGQTFGGWNWNSATRILATASEVTSQVSSVLDSVVNPPRSATGQQKTSDLENKNSKQTSSGACPSQPVTKTSMSVSDAASNDALVDLTLSAMESLGKKAFGAMTHRDETGSLQIKGLGRPWEPLLNIKKSQTESQKGDSNLREVNDEPTIPTQSMRVVDSDIRDKDSSIRRRAVNYTDSDKLD